MDALTGDQWIAELEMMEGLGCQVGVSLSSESFSSCTSDNYYGENNEIKIIGNNSGAVHYSTCSSSSPSDHRTPTNFLTLAPGHTNAAANYDLMPQVVNSKAVNPKPELDNYEAMNYSSSQHEGKESLQGRNKRIFNSCSAPANCNSISQDHILAERKRREKLSQRFIALSALIPGLTKMDKASVLGDAVKYMKHLQEQIKTLEEKLKERNESLLLVKKSHLYMDDDDNEGANSSSSNQEISHLSSNDQEVAFPEIEARIMDNHVLIRIHCQQIKRLLAKIFKEIANLGLFVTHSNSMPFGTSDLVITLVAQMNADVDITARALVSKLRRVF